MSKKLIKVLIADDSGFMQLLIKSILKQDTSIEVVATAYNGQEAAEKTMEFKPDVVLMDILMPKYDGVYGVRRIMKERPTPIVILSSIGNKNIDAILSTLKLGAFDYLNKPEGSSAKLRTIDSAIVDKIKLAAKVDTDKLLLPKEDWVSRHHSFTKKSKYEVLVLGSSTGGPNALEKVLSKLPRNIPVSILVAQHMPANFIESFAARLHQTIPNSVKVAVKGDVLEIGKVLIAPGDRNIVVRKNKVTGDVIVDEVKKQFKEYNNPSINSLMFSVAEVYGDKAIGVILTGMGEDGASALSAIKEKGGRTIVQDKATSVVFGMPKEAISRGCVDRVMPVNKMGDYIVKCLS
ncbi:MAG: chemotaxis-specific protein-glutamate methyltransferase CheB [Reichenbachiella sp.]